MAREAGVKADIHKSGWEASEFPIVCETCLGDNPFVRMTKANFDKECKICARPFTVFRWKPGPRARYKKTEVCQTCSKLKNVCQTCLLDLEYGLPVQVRDTLIPPDEKEFIPKSDVNREYFAGVNAQRVAEGSLTASGKLARDPTLSKLARSTPYYKRNAPHICSFFVKGECKRGDECPYRHEMPTEGPLAVQNIKDRYAGKNDPVAQKMLQKTASWRKLTPPEDKSITTLWIGGLPAHATEADIRDVFYAYGEIDYVRMHLLAFCAFVTYTTREAAVKATEELGTSITVAQKGCTLGWSKPQQRVPAAGRGVIAGAVPLKPIPPPVGLAPPPGLNIPAYSGPAYYPSMSGAQEGAKPEGSSTEQRRQG